MEANYEVDRWVQFVVATAVRGFVQQIANVFEEWKKKGWSFVETEWFSCI